MSGDDTAKVTPARLRRDAYLYIRQSTLYQVIHNTESTGRQYDLKGRAVALGWPEDKIHVIDIDQGRSGASAADRAGFQHLVAEVSLGRAGIVLGLECSRLARDSADWQQLVKICAHADTLICDEDGLYDPAIFNDRVLLGMKGQISEFELHFLRARMRGGILAKARRGELALALPAGLVRDHQGQVTLDPDAGVRDAVRLLFGTFTATGSAFGVVKAFREQQLTFPARHHRGPRRGELFFQPLTHDRVLSILHIPAYDQRLQNRGLLTLGQIAADLDAHPSSIKRWHRLGLITGEQADDRGVFRYHPGQARPSGTDTENARKRLGYDHRCRRNPHRKSGRPRKQRQMPEPPATLKPPARQPPEHPASPRTPQLPQGVPSKARSFVNSVTARSVTDLRIRSS